MAVGKEVKIKINSIKSTQKITSAMEMVAASKMRRAQERMMLGKPYANRIRKVINHIANATAEYRHDYMKERETIKAVGYIVISTDRGLCGGLNVNEFKQLTKEIANWQEQKVDVKFCAIGNKAMTFFNNYGGELLVANRDLGDTPHIGAILGSITVMLKAFVDGKIDKLYLVSNEFVNTMTQKPQIRQLIPLPSSDQDEIKHHWDYIYEPDEAHVLLSDLINRYIESQVYQGVVENKACEMASRMIAMKNATENAGNFIDELQLLYNKTRQAAITQELSEIVSGAAAL